MPRKPKQGSQAPNNSHEPIIASPRWLVRRRWVARSMAFVPLHLASCITGLVLEELLCKSENHWVTRDRHRRRQRGMSWGAWLARKDIRTVKTLPGRSYRVWEAVLLQSGERNGGGRAISRPGDQPTRRSAHLVAWAMTSASSTVRISPPSITTSPSTIVVLTSSPWAE